MLTLTQLQNNISLKVDDIRRIKNAYIFYIKQEFNKGKIAGQRDRQNIVSKVIKPNFDHRRLMLACLALSSIIPIGIILCSNTLYNEATFAEIILLFMAYISYEKSKIKLGEK